MPGSVPLGILVLSEISIIVFPVGILLLGQDIPPPSEVLVIESSICF
ncbi:Uncharacterised protein [Chlamydia trachomatis]|nr:Uncharacterised protein [Chlamydia trachomatis]